MRITSGMYYNNLYENNNKMNGQLFDVNKQIASGLKIQYSNEDPQIFLKTMKLDDEITTLNQVKKSSESAMKFSTQTDTTIGDLSKAIESFKVKLTYAANAGHSQTSLNAITQELKGLRDHMMSLANTSINGQYLFSGTATDTKPINSDGSYNGNDGDLKTFFGNGVQQTYNVTGKDLFFGDETTVKREVTTNISLYNQTQLYPDVMQDENIPRGASKEEYISTQSTIRDMMGDSDKDIDVTNAKHHFYISGVKHEGDSFKKTISMRDDESVEDLLLRIGEAYGNSAVGKVVDVNLNNTGQIVVTDKLSGSSKLQFNMVGNTNDIIDDPATTDANGAAIDLSSLYTTTTSVKEFIKSDYSKMVDTTTIKQDKYDLEVFESKNSFLTKDGKFSNSNTLLKDIFSSDVKSINFNGTQTDGTTAVTDTFFDITATSTLGDLMNSIKTNFDSGSTASGQDLGLSLMNGKLRFESKTESLDISLTSYDTVGGATGGGNLISGMPVMGAVVFDDASFLKDGSFLKSNISQVVKDTNTYANEGTKLKDVASLNSLVGETLNFNGIDIHGARFGVQFNFIDNSGVPAEDTTTFDILDVDGTILSTHNIYDIDGTTVTDPDNLTYKQFMNVINVVASGTALAEDSASLPEDEFQDFIDAVENSKYSSETYLNNEGKLTFKDKTSASTKAQFSLFDPKSTDMSDANGSILSFQSNNALTISDPKNNFFAALDHIIKSVQDGKYDADGFSSDPRNIGIQNSIQLIDDVADHMSRQQTQAGVHSQVLESMRNRSELLIVNSQMLRSDVIDTDLAEASLKLNQLSLNYQAMLSTVSKVTKLSLVNYL
jgi:flagellar hook-associated protein 3 FlgL